VHRALFRSLQPQPRDASYPLRSNTSSKSWTLASICELYTVVKSAELVTMSSSLPTGRSSAPPWRYSPSLGGEYVYNPNADELVLRSGQRLPRPQHMPRSSLMNASWVGPYQFQYSGSPPTDRPSRPPRADSTAFQYPGAPLTGYPSTPRRQQITTPGGAIPASKTHVLASLPEDPDYKIRDKRFFRVGRVFLVLWSEPAGGSPSETLSLLNDSSKHLAPRIFTKVRRFVVIREGEGYCNGLPISTYGGRGVAKRGVTKAEHAIIYTGRTEPRVRTDELPGRREAGMLATPIRVDPDNMNDQLDPMSRVDFGGVAKIQHNFKVKALGFVNSTSMHALQRHFREIWFLPTNTPIKPTNTQIKRDDEPRDDSKGKDRGKIDDSEEDDDDEDDEEDDNDDDSEDDDESEDQEEEEEEEEEEEDKKEQGKKGGGTETDRPEEGRKGGGGREEQEQISDWTIPIHHEESEPNGLAARTK
jgi:hypothetical protein